MATNIEQIFRSFVVSKFREIQEKQLGSGKLGQQNGEINSSEEENSADDTIASFGTLQNDPLVQKIEQVLSEVLGAESQYKPDVEQDIVKSKSSSTKRGLSDEVQDEVPRKKSKKDKKHKDKKKKKKRKKEKKEKKYKKQSKESKLSSDHKVCEDVQPASHFNPESLVLNAENVDVEPASPLKHGSEWFMEKTVYENLNSSLSNSHQVSNLDTNKLDASEDSVLTSIQDLCELELTNERELENRMCQHTSLTVNLHTEDKSLNTADVEADGIRMATVAATSTKEMEQPEDNTTLLTSTKEMEQPEDNTALLTTEHLSFPENSPKLVAVEPEVLEMSVEPCSVEVKEFDSLSESLDPEIMAQPESTSFEKTGCKVMKTTLETIVEAKDSVTTLGFLAMVVGKDFEATSEFLNKAKVKASESGPNNDAFTAVKDELEQGSERSATIKDLEETLQIEHRTEEKDSERISESNKSKGIDASVVVETMGGMRELKETQTSAHLMELKDPLKDKASLETVPDRKGYKRIPEFEIIKRTYSGAYHLATEVETKKLEASTEFEELDGKCLRATSVCESEKEKQDIILETPRMVGVKNLDSFPEFVGAIQVNYLEASSETVVENKRGVDAIELSKTVVEVKASENIPRSEAVPEIKDLETATETLNIAKPQYLDASKHVATTDIERETVVNLKDLKIFPEQPSVNLKNLETVSETLHTTEIKHVKDVLQSDAMAQGKDSEINLKLVGQGERRNLDAASESLHMIFANYSEIYAEPEVIELKNSEGIPELLPMDDSSTTEELLTREAKDLKTIESAAIVKLSDLGKKSEYLHRDEKNREAESEAVTEMKYLEESIPSEVVAKEKDTEIVSYFVTGVTEKALDTTNYVGMGQDDDETVDLEIKPGCQKVKDVTERDPSAQIKGPLFISESFQEMNIVSSETTPELTVVQQLKETGGVTPVLDADSPRKIFGLEKSALFVPQDVSKLLNTGDDFESISGHRAVQNLESVQLGKANVREVNLDSQPALEDKYSSPSAELLFSDALSNLPGKQEESTGTISLTAAPGSLYALGTDLIVASESDQIERVIDSEHSSRSLNMAQTNSDNFLKSSYKMPVKDSETIARYKTMDARDLEIDSESSHRDASDNEKHPENESVVASQVLEIIGDSPKKNKMEESNTTSGNNALSVTDLEVDSGTKCVMDIENLEAVKTTHVAPTSLFPLGMIDIEDTPIPVCAEEDSVKASEIIASVEVKSLEASATSVDTLKTTIDPTHVTDTKDSKANQIMKAHLESVDKREVNTEFEHGASPSGLEIFEKDKSVVGTEVILPAVKKAERTCTDLTLEAALVEKYSESVSGSVDVSETEDCDAALSMFLIDVKDSESTSAFVDTGEVKALKTMLPFETTPEPLCVLELGESDDVAESVLTTEMKDLGETLNCDVVLDAKDPVPAATNVNTSELKSSESVCMLEITDSEGMPKLKSTPAYLSLADLKSSDTTAEMETLNIIDSEIPLKQKMEVKYFGSVSETDYVLEPFPYKAVLQSECISEEKVSETTSEAVCMKEAGDLEMTPSKHAQEIKDLEPFTQSVCTVQARCIKENLIYEEVLDVSETPQFSSIVEIEDLGVKTSVVAEMGKYSEKSQLHFEGKCPETATEFAHVPDVMDAYADVQPDCRAEGKYSESTAEIACAEDIKSTEVNSSILTELKDAAFLKSKSGPETVHVKDLEIVPKDESVSKVQDLQGLHSSVDKDEGLSLDGSSKSLLILEQQDLERDSTSMLMSKAVSEVSLDSVSVVKAKDSEAALNYVNGKSLEISEQSAECICIGEIKGLKSASEHAVLAKADDSEMFPKVASEVKELEATLEPCLMKEKDSEAATVTSLEEPVLKVSLKPTCVAEENNLEASKQVPVEVKDSEAILIPVTMAKKDLQATSCASNQYSEAVPKSSEITKENDESISKDRKSEKVSSKSKDKSKSGKKAKKSRSKSPSKSKKRKKKSRSRSTSRQISSRRQRSRSKNDSDSRRKHSTSRRKSRSKSTDRKEGKESSLRSRRRRSRTSDRHKSRSKSADKRESSLRSRRRRSRSSDRRKSRSRSVERRESVRTRRRLSRSSDNHKSRSKSVDKRETSRSRRRRSRSSDHRKSRSRSTDRRETSTRIRRRWSRSSDNHRSRSRSVNKRETSLRRRTRRSRSSDNYKSRSKSVDRRESSVRSRRRRSRSSDHHKSRSRSGDDKREISVRTRRKRSRSSENRRSRSVDRRESLRSRRRRSKSSDNKSRSRSGDRETLRTRRRRSRSSANRKSRSKSFDKQESSVRTRRRRSRSSDNHKSRSKSVDKRESSVRTKRRRSRSSDRKSRSKSIDTRETSARAKSRRSRSLDNRKSRSKSAEKRETSTKSKSRRSRSSDNRKSRSKSIDKRETSVRAKRRRSRSSDNRKSRSKSIDKRETSARAKRRRSRSSDNHKSRSKSVDKRETSARSKRRRSKSSDHKSVTKSDEKRDSSLKPRHRRSKSLDRQKSKSKSRSKSPERRKEKDSSDGSKGKLSKSRSKSKSPEKTEGAESLEVSVSNRAKSPEHPKSKSRSRSKSLDKTEDRDRSRRSRSKGSESKSHGHRTVSRSRRNRSNSLTRKRTSRSKSEHRSRSRSRSRSCSRRWRRTRSRSVSRQRSLSRERRRRSRRNRSRSIDRRRRRSDSRESYRITLRLRSRSRTPVRLRTSRSTGRRRSTSVSPDHRRSRSSSRSPKRLTDLDKAQLLEIAKANAAAMCAKAGVPLPPSLMPVVTPEKKEEKVTQKSAKETIMELTEKCKKIAQSQEDDVIVNKPHVSDEEEEEHPFINHPFKLNEPKPIFFNLTTPTIKPAPPKNQVTLTKEFPVSSGSQHRKKEADSAYGEWVPVEKNKEENKDDVFPNPATLEPVDISSALSERTIAQKRLTENTFDLEAMCLLNRAQERIDAWAQLNSLPGQFTGSTGAQVLSSEQLSNSGPQAWIKKDQFLRAAPVTGGMGAQLMRKMGWREGEGLGKNKEGSKEPILVDFKTDRKGLVAIGEKTQKRHPAFSAVKDLAGKHPISLLMEACNKRRWAPPIFVLVTDNGPDHRKCFLFKVMVNGVEHKPTFASPNKKLAKATAATVALQALGIVPKDLLANATSFRSASHN